MIHNKPVFGLMFVVPVVLQEEINAALETKSENLCSASEEFKLVDNASGKVLSKPYRNRFRKHPFIFQLVYIAVS